MKLLDNYSVSVAELEDTQDMFNILAPIILKHNQKYGDTINMHVRKLRGAILSATEKGEAYLLRYGINTIGVYIMETLDNQIFIVHTNVLEQYRNGFGSLLIIDYILNTIYKDKTVFMYGSPDKASNITITRHSGANRIKPTIASRVAKAVKYHWDRYNGK